MLAADSDPFSLERLCGLLSRCHVVAKVERVSTPEGLAAALGRSAHDLVIVDAAMFGDALREPRFRSAPLVAVASCSGAEACRAIELGAIDYVLKPWTGDRLDVLLGRAMRLHALLDAQRRAFELEGLVEQLRANELRFSERSYETEFWVRQRGRDHIRVPVDAIDMITVQEDYTCLHVGDREHLLRSSLDRVLGSLDPRVFVRIHRAVAVRADRIWKLRSPKRGRLEAVMVDGASYRVGRVHARALERRIDERRRAHGSGRDSEAGLRSRVLT